MSRSMRIITKTFGVPLAAIASAILGNGIQAADVSTPVPVNAFDAAQTPIEKLEELDEIWVRGKRLSEMIEDAEDDFFVLYNKLNKNYDYDVFCGLMSLQSGSMIMARRCVPGFIVSNYGDEYGRINDWGDGCSGFGSYSTGRRGARYRYCNAFEYQPPSGSASLKLPIEHMMMAKRPAYAANVLKVVTSDPRLQEKVRNLSALYRDMESVQGRYVKVKRDAAPPRGSRNSGPRAL